MKILSSALLASAAALSTAAPLSAQLPTPPMAVAITQAQPYLFHGGAGDVLEITTSMIALQHSRNPSVRAFSTMLIDHHTQLTNAALATAKAAGVTPPPPELSPAQKAMVGQLIAASPANFDRLFLTQQVAAHQQALALQQSYAARGDVPALRQAAQTAVPVVQAHLGEAQQMMGTLR